MMIQPASCGSFKEIILIFFLCDHFYITHIIAELDNLVISTLGTVWGKI